MRIRHPWRAAKNLLINKSPAEAQLIVTRRCNLSCGYCTEYDTHSPSIPYPTLKERIDALHRLGVVQIAMLGGEPLMHEDIDKVISHAGSYSQTSMTTNGFLISKDMVAKLNDAGLDHMQVSIDTLKPSKDLYIQKSMKTITKKLELLIKEAHFTVHSNIVLCDASLPDFKEMVRGLRDFNIPVTVNLLHDERGAVEIEGDKYLEMWKYHHENSRVISHIEHGYGEALLKGERPEWMCRAGGRHIYVDEFGMAQFCASQRGRLNKPITEYTMEDVKRHSNEPKGCESGCAVFCVYRASQFDNDRVGVTKAVLKGMKDSTIKLPSLRREKRVASPLEHAGGAKQT
jgi:molybdenum cofactor biosynthesis enzyme MoaA